MDQETKAGMVAGGLVLQQQVEAVIEKQSEIIASAFELMMIVSPGTALDIVEQLSEQITEETINEVLESRQEYFDGLKSRVTAD